MLVDMLNKKNQGNIFRYFIGDLMNADVNYYDEVESKNMSDRIAVVISEEVNDLDTVKKYYHTLIQYIW